MKKNLNFFFISGMIRSGTTYLTKLLNESNKISAIFFKLEQNPRMEATEINFLRPPCRDFALA